jgi:hypothetical protein
LPTSGSIPEDGTGADPRRRHIDWLGEAVLADPEGLQKLLIKQLQLVYDCWTPLELPVSRSRVATDVGGHVDVD